MSNNDADSSSNNNSSEEEILRKQLKPDPTADQVIDAVRTYFYNGKEGVDIKLKKELDSYDDRNFWITVDGINYLAKVHNGVESRDLIQYLQKDNESSGYQKSAIHLQNAIMTHLNDCGISTNKPQEPTIHNTSSTPVVVVSLPVHSKEDSPTPLVLRLLGWVNGRPMSDFQMLPIECLADAGRFLGNLSVALSSLPDVDQLDAAKRYHQWDGKNTVDLRDFVKYVTDDRRRSIVESVIDAFQKDLIDSKVAEQSFEKSLIHADFNDANFLLGGDFCVSGVIDFGDSVESWKILDLSVAMAYAMLNAFGKHHRSLAAAAAVLRGYNSVRPITPEERRHLPLLIACRLSCSATLGAYSYAQNPGNEYLLLHATPAWNALDLIWGTDPEHRLSVLKTIHELFDLACSSCSTDKKTGIVDCSDLNFPDPSMPDPFEASRKRKGME
mmetsp:Transcript_27678/g.60951  ORF Transcript_27678/g.60951 Transcript_27678/m.60951 type:complete len:442 (-) Transcript_27678:55-1380(-)|eukprot:CAMPEP_0168191524 /NCGR_PEP_ID=MMETSP0139_2-20121125/17564_1 /TAXON_ID=44445 /ORGANISM="Pseudo-nitzschia australis, Strain 10249 10 AB" /LENGTH=441 /DNA_ID=CAMNT_0008114709 /DNA_START=152 /DNA_END=1477 /DNA_ORIENTATION=-